MNDNKEYTPADDENQGVMTKLMQGKAAGGGVAQSEYMNPIVNQGPEPEKAEVNENEEDENETNGINEEMLIEEDVENSDIDERNDD